MTIPHPNLRLRLARPGDMPVLSALMDRAIGELLRDLGIDLAEVRDPDAEQLLEVLAHGALEQRAIAALGDEPHRVDAAHDEVDLHAGLAGAVERFDDPVIDERVELGKDARRFAVRSPIAA